MIFDHSGKTVETPVPPSPALPAGSDGRHWEWLAAAGFAIFLLIVGFNEIRHHFSFEVFPPPPSETTRAAPPYGHLMVQMVCQQEGPMTTVTIGSLRFLIPDESFLGRSSSEVPVIMRHSGWSGSRPAPGGRWLEFYTVGATATFYFRGREWHFTSGVISIGGQTFDVARDQAVILMDRGASTGRVLRRRP